MIDNCSSSDSLTGLLSRWQCTHHTQPEPEHNQLISTRWWSFPWRILSFLHPSLSWPSSPLCPWNSWSWPITTQQFYSIGQWEISIVDLLVHFLLFSTHHHQSPPDSVEWISHGNRSSSHSLSTNQRLILICVNQSEINIDMCQPIRDKNYIL